MSFVVRDYTALLTARDYTSILLTAHAHNNWVWGTGGRVRARDTPMLTTPSKRGVELREAQRSGHYKVCNGPTWLQVYNTVVLFRSLYNHMCLREPRK